MSLGPAGMSLHPVISMSPAPEIQGPVGVNLGLSMKTQGPTSPYPRADMNPISKSPGFSSTMNGHFFQRERKLKTEAAVERLMLGSKSSLGLDTTLAYVLRICDSMT